MLWKKVKLLLCEKWEKAMKNHMFSTYVGILVEKLVNFLSEWFDTSISFTLLFMGICYDFNIECAADV